MSWHTECHNCDDYSPNITIIDSGLQLMETHGFKPKINSFIFCPYCGKKLKKINDKTGKEEIDKRQLRLL